MTPGTCDACGALPDELDVDDPWEDVAEAAPTYQAQVVALDALRRVPGQSDLSNDCVKRCAACGAHFLWSYSYWHNGDRDHLNVQRLSGVRAELLVPLIERDDEATLREAVLAAFAHPDATVAAGAEHIFECLLHWKSPTPLQLRLFAALAGSAAPAAQTYGCRALAGWARTDRKTAEQVSVALDAVTVDAVAGARLLEVLAEQLGEEADPSEPGPPTRKKG